MTNWLNKNTENILFVVPARINSTRLPRKIIKDFAGSTLFDIALENLKKVNNIPHENIIIQVKDEELVEKAEKHGFNVFLRSEDSLKEPITLHEVYDWWNKFDLEYYIRLNICNPLITSQTIDDFIDEFIRVPRGLFAVLEKKTFFFNRDGNLISKFLGDMRYVSTLETKLIEPLYEAAHTLYAGKCSDIENDVYMGSFIEPLDPAFFIMDNSEFGDIDELWQFELYEKIYQQRIKAK
ncbi:unnamed protein product [marine sediment metagenome]|uniref:Acylneuraminate cytidylyltransferase n=1 Tax=marine sediment metagenome TaxID=412755 RepID=X0YWB7_9ZZZZ